MNDFEQNNFSETETSAASDIIPDITRDTSYEAAYREYEMKKRFNRMPLILALLGLVFSVFYGSGIVFGIVAFVMSIKRYRIHKSEPLKWALILSITCIALCTAFILSLCGTCLLAVIKQNEQETQSLISLLKYII